MIPGQLVAPWQFTVPGINFASVHGLTPVTVHMSFCYPRATSRGGLKWVRQVYVCEFLHTTLIQVNITVNNSIKNRHVNFAGRSQNKLMFGIIDFHDHID